MSNKYEIWSEGFSVIEEHASARFEGVFEGETFMDAYLDMVKQQYGANPPDYVKLNEPVIWGCRCFDNEIDARKSFG